MKRALMIVCVLSMFAAMAPMVWADGGGGPGGGTPHPCPPGMTCNAAENESQCGDCCDTQALCLGCWTRLALPPNRDELCRNECYNMT